ncbi:hypothetical protein [Aeromonas veronii]|uniref:hypothetical protein n=1 Tax=Aeromonas veronii TaxID=654 RepID=UPI003BA20F2A
MYNKFIGAKNDVLKSGAFIAAIFIPLILSIAVALMIKFVPAFVPLLSSLWETMKLPIAIASLSIPLATWAIANHGSARVTETLKMQDRKQLSELYFEQEKLFEKVLTRKIEHYEFKYITAQDLPVIHATIFNYKNIYQHGRIAFNNSICEKIKEAFDTNNDVNRIFYEKFTEEKNGNNDSIKICNLTSHYITTIQHNLMILAPYTGCRILREGTTGLGMLVSAHIEIEHMLLEINQYILDGVSTHYLTEDDYELYNAILNLTTAYYGCKPDELTITKIQDITRTKVTIKHITQSDLHRFIFNAMEKIRPLINEVCSHLTVVQEDLEYLSLKIFSSNPNDFIRVFFVKENTESEKQGVLKAQWNDEFYDIDVIMKNGGFTVGKNNIEQNHFVNSILMLSQTLYYMDANDKAEHML